MQDTVTRNNSAQTTGSRKAAPARVYAITSGKGGVGKTSTTVNLGMALAQAGKRVLLLDADLGLANINILLGFKANATIREVINGKAALKDVIVKTSAGFDIIPAASGVPELTNLNEQERIALIAAVDELGENYDYLLVDTAAGIGDNVMYFCVAAEEVLVVINHEPTSITDAYAVIKVLATHYGRKEFNILVNSCPRAVDPRNTYRQLADATDHFLQVRLNYLGSIAEDESVAEAVVSQKPYLQLFPSAAASRDIGKLAQRILSNEGERQPKGGLQFFFDQLVRSAAGKN